MDKEEKESLLEKLADLMLAIDKGLLSLSSALQEAEPIIQRLEDAGYGKS